jgi:ankyrin repeat protein
MSSRNLPSRSVARFVAVLSLLAVFAVPVRADMNEDFVIAVANDRAGEVRTLLAKGADPNARGQNGEPVLLIAAREGSMATVDALLAGNADVNLASPVGNTAIMAAAISGKLEIVKKLRARGAVIDGRGWTPLIYAATGGHDAIVAYLLAEGANINAVSPNGTSALMMAVREGKGSTVSLLIAKGADVNVRNDSGATALAWAVRGNEKDMAAALRRAGARD